MQAGILMTTYILTAITLQFAGFLISRLVDYQFPAWSMMTFLLLFIAAFGLAWPLAVLIAEALIRRLGYQVETADPRVV